MRRRFLIGILIALPFTVLITGCGGGVNGEGTNTYPQTGGVTIVRSDSFNDQGWEMFANGNYDSAIAQFQKVLSDSPTAEEEAEANNGLGWAKSRLGMLTDGMPWFEKAKALSDDAKVGLASAYVQKGAKADLETAVSILLTELGKGNSHFHYTPRRPTGVTDAEVHALLSYCYAALGNVDEATDQMDYAKELNPGWASSTIDQLDKMVEFLQR